MISLLIFGEPPLSELHPMRVLFLIPKNAPPVLEGNFSKGFKEFVALCLAKEPEQRPTAATLVKHRFTRSAKKPSTLVGLIERRDKWKAAQDDSESSDDKPENTDTTVAAPEWQWKDTVKGAPNAQEEQQLKAEEKRKEEERKKKKKRKNGKKLQNRRKLRPRKEKLEVWRLKERKSVLVEKKGNRSLEEILIRNVIERNQKSLLL